MNERPGPPVGKGSSANPEGRHGPPGVPPFWKRRWFGTAALCLGVFVAGTCLGSFLTLAIIHHRVRRHFRNPDLIASRMVSHMRRGLDLTDEQADKILPILKARNQALSETMREHHDSIAEEIESVLTEEQLAKHRKIVEERRARFFGPHSGKRGGKR